jgi:acetylornithine deacetylase
MPRPLTAECLSRLAAFDTTSRNSNLELIAWAEDFLRQHGAETDRVYNAEGTKANLWATFSPSGAPGLILSGHTDVVPVDGQAWSSDPFKLIEREECYFARGACDMKAFLAVCMAAAPKLASQRLKMPIHFAFSYDEEVGCVGVRTLLDDLRQKGMRFEGCIVGEPTGMAVAIGHKGKRSLRATITGTSGHSCQAPQLVNAVEHGARIAAKICDIGRDLARNGLRDPLYDIQHTTSHVGVFQGGTALNIVPDHAVLDFEFRVLPDEDADAYVEQISTFIRDVVEPDMRAVDERAGVELVLRAQFPGLSTPRDAAIASLAGRFARTNAVVKVAYGAEAGLFHEYLNVPTVICGPGFIDQAHKPDEFIALKQIEQCERFFDGVIQYAGGSP